MTDFHTRLDQAIKAAGISYRDLSIRIGVGEAYITNLLRNQSEPGFGTTQKICQILGISLNDLAGIHEKVEITSKHLDPTDIDLIAQGVYSRLASNTWIAPRPMGQRPGIDEVIDWWASQGGVLQNFDQIAEYIDLFTPPDDSAQMIDPYKIGSASLVSQVFGIEDGDNLRRVLSELSQQQNQEIVFSHRETGLGKPILSVEEVDVGIAGKGRIQVRYKRILLPVHDQSGREFVLNYATPLTRFK